MASAHSPLACWALRHPHRPTAMPATRTAPHPDMENGHSVSNCLVELGRGIGGLATLYIQHLQGAAATEDLTQPAIKPARELSPSPSLIRGRWS